MPRSSRPLSERFLEKVPRGGPDQCWEWTAGKDRRGYGRINSGKGSVALAHRVAWEVANGPIPDDLCVCHHCDNPPCCNPAHLFLGTRADNNADMAAKGRARVPGLAGEAHPNAKLTGCAVREIRDRYGAGESPTSIARDHGISRMTVYRVTHGRAWASERVEGLAA